MAEVRKFSVMKYILWIALIIFTGYVLLTYYGYYHNSVRVTGIVSSVGYISTTERRMSGDCSSRRNTCSGLYSYDTSWWRGGKAYVFHTTRELKYPSSAMCVQFVQSNPDIVKLCHHLLFNASLVPHLMFLWSIVAFMSLTRFLYHKCFLNLPMLVTYQVINRRHQLLLETQDREEALRFINRGYRICTMTHQRTVIRVERKKVVSDCTVYSVRGVRGRRN